MAAQLAKTGCWLGKRNSDLASVLSPCLHPDYIEAVLKWLLGKSNLDRRNLHEVVLKTIFLDKGNVITYHHA